MASWDDQAGSHQRSASGPCGWCWTTSRSTTRNGRRSGWSQSRSGVHPGRSVIGPYAEVSIRSTPTPSTPAPTSPSSTPSKLTQLCNHSEGVSGVLDQVELATLEWIDWYNHRRLHEALEDLPPAEHEAAHHTATRPALPAGNTQRTRFLHNPTRDGSSRQRASYLGRLSLRRRARPVDRRRSYGVAHICQCQALIVEYNKTTTS